MIDVSLAKLVEWRALVLRKRPNHGKENPENS
jgi:hypothetical protein